MQTLEIGSTRYTTVYAIDEPGAGGAHHHYLIRATEASVETVFGHVWFQHGPVAEQGVNGCHQEDLLAIVIHRLQSFQAGPYACRENALALTKLQECLMWLEFRTRERSQRGVEGTSQP